MRLSRVVCYSDAMSVASIASVAKSGFDRLSVCPISSNIYDIDHSGRIVRKQPGRHSRWEVFMDNHDGREKQFSFLSSIGQETKCFFRYCRMLGNDWKKIEILS
eukprot:scaffold5886_cov93-Cylindrotheca_fusiformis.AAC.5